MSLDPFEVKLSIDGENYTYTSTQVEQMMDKLEKNLEEFHKYNPPIKGLNHSHMLIDDAPVIHGDGVKKTYAKIPQLTSKWFWNDPPKHSPNAEWDVLMGQWVTNNKQAEFMGKKNSTTFEFKIEEEDGIGDLFAEPSGIAPPGKNEDVEGYKTTKDAAAKAESLDLLMVEPVSDVLFLDLDDKVSRDRYVSNKKILMEKVPGFILEEFQTVSKNGNTHVYLRLDRKIKRLTKIGLQVILGSDAKRGALGFGELLSGVSETPNVFFETPEEFKRVRAAGKPGQPWFHRKHSKKQDKVEIPQEPLSQAGSTEKQLCVLCYTDHYVTEKCGWVDMDEAVSV